MSIVRTSSLTRSIAALALGGICLGLSSCSESRDTPSSADDVTSQTSELDGRSFFVTSVTGSPSPLVPGTAVTLTFEQGKAVVVTGCNNLSADGVRIIEGRLQLSPLAQTEMGCEPALMAQERWLADFFQAEPTIALDGDSLQLRDSDITMDLAVDQPIGIDEVPLEGTLWRAVTLLRGQGPEATASTVPPKPPVTLRIRDGFLMIKTGCNSGRATVRVDSQAGVWELDDLFITRVACPDRAEIESAYLSILDRPSFELGPRSLELRSAAGDLALIFEPKATPSVTVGLGQPPQQP